MIYLLYAGDGFGKAAVSADYTTLAEISAGWTGHLFAPKRPFVTSALRRRRLPQDRRGPVDNASKSREFAGEP
ncbi:MAG TPA: hypothetical protein DC046_07055 [Rhodospirillaceae bacterium]|nr:hypothetical protein [Rhodospirillaceae bacterium]|tara:strand:+ start:316 stop:534 length:219 start_codon:yes stop_codon:yes gene_type:complete